MDLKLLMEILILYLQVYSFDQHMQEKAVIRISSDYAIASIPDTTMLIDALNDGSIDGSRPGSRPMSPSFRKTRGT